MKQKHTPGPWEYDIYEGSLYVFGPDGEMVANGSDVRMDAAIVRMRGAGADLPLEANAALIAAAPELLDVCKRLVGFCSKRDGSLAPYEDWIQTFVEDGSTITEVVGKAIAAIAKAETAPETEDVHAG